MTTDRPRRRGPYVPLTSHYYNDEAVAGVGEKAELLYLRGLAFCAGNPSDGFISDAQLRQIGAGLTGKLGERATKLVQSGLWIRDKARHGFVVKSWLKWNASAADIAAAQEAERERKRRARNRFRPAGQPADVRPDSGDLSGRKAYTTPTPTPELSLRSPSGTERSDTSGRRVAASARGADAPPEQSSVVDEVPAVPDWRAPRTAAKPPDLSDIRAELARVAARTKAKSNMRPEAMAELRQATAVNGSHLNGDATE